MATNFPTALDSFTNPAADDLVTGPGTVPHHAQHANVNDAVAALEAKVGINSSTDPASLDAKVGALDAVYPTTPSPSAGQILVADAQAAYLAKSVSGDASLAASGTLTLATSGVTAGTYGDATHVAQVTVDAKGRVTAASSVAITGGSGSPGGVTTEVQYNDAGAFGGDAGMVYDKTNHTLTITDSATHTVKLQDSNGSGYVVSAAAGTISAQLASGTIAAALTDATNTVQLCNGTMAFRGQGKIGTDQASNGFTSLGNVVGRMPIYDPSGTLLGYMPIYDNIT